MIHGRIFHHIFHKITSLSAPMKRSFFVPFQVIGFQMCTKGQKYKPYILKYKALILK